MLRFLTRVGILLAICLSSQFAAADENECLLVEVDFEGVVDATGDLGPLVGMVEEGSRMSGSYQIKSCATPSGAQRNQTSYMDAIQPDDFNMEIGNVRFWPSSDTRVQMSIGVDVKSGKELWRKKTVNSRE